MHYLKTLLANGKSEYLFISELSANTAAFAKSAAMLGNSEDHTALSRALSQLAEVEEKIDQLHQEQAFADFYMFSELLSDYIRLIAAVKVSLILRSSLNFSHFSGLLLRRIWLSIQHGFKCASSVFCQDILTSR